MVVKTWPEDGSMVLRSTAMVAATLGPGAVFSADNKPPGSPAKAIAMLRSELIKAIEYRRKRGLEDSDKQPARNLRLEALVDVLAGDTPLLVNVNRHLDILATLRLAREFDLKLVLDGVTDAPLVLEAIRDSGFPVIVHPTMARAFAEFENASFETAAKLHGAGIPIAFQSGYESYVPKTRVALFEAAIAVAHGLPADAGLAALTIEPARILGLADRLGSLEHGKDADLALFDADPFEYTSRCLGVIVSGEAVGDIAQ
jgi:imidazolonepropionase-like amidohydrolase